MTDQSIKTSLLEYLHLLKACKNEDEIVYFLFSKLHEFEKGCPSASPHTISSIVSSVLSDRRTLPFGHRLYSHFYDNDGKIVENYITFSSSSEFSLSFSTLFLVFISRVENSVQDRPFKVQKDVSVNDSIFNYIYNDTLTVDLLCDLFKLPTVERQNFRNRGGDNKSSDNNHVNITNSNTSNSVNNNNQGVSRNFSSSSRRTEYEYEADILDGKVVKIRFMNLASFSESYHRILSRDNALRNLR